MKGLCRQTVRRHHSGPSLLSCHPSKPSSKPAISRAISRVISRVLRHRAILILRLFGRFIPAVSELSWARTQMDVLSLRNVAKSIHHSSGAGLVSFWPGWTSLSGFGGCSHPGAADSLAIHPRQYRPVSKQVLRVPSTWPALLGRSSRQRPRPCYRLGDALGWPVAHCQTRPNFR